MGVVNVTTLYDNNFDFSNASSSDVYFAFIIRMPFRFRVSSPYHLRFQNDGHEYDIWIRNRPIVDAKSGSFLHSLKQQGGVVEDLWSTVAIIPHKREISDDELIVLRNSQNKSDNIPFEGKAE